MNNMHTVAFMLLIFSIVLMVPISFEVAEAPKRGMKLFALLILSNVVFAGLSRLIMFILGIDA